MSKSEATYKELEEQIEQVKMTMDFLNEVTLKKLDASKYRQILKLLESFLEINNII